MTTSHLPALEPAPIDASLMRAMFAMLVAGVLLFVMVAITDDRQATRDRADSATIQVQWKVGDW